MRANRSDCWFDGQAAGQRRDLPCSLGSQGKLGGVETEATEGFDREAYRRWQDRAELAELERAARYRRRIIEQGDSECEEAIAALEAGWRRERCGREDR
jgi:hypothetical protein